MHEYRCQRTVNIATSATSLSNRNMLPLPPQANQETWTSMDTQYGLTDMDIITQEESEPSIEEEYASYVTMPAYRLANIVNYWEVGSIALCPLLLFFSHLPHRPPSSSTPHFLQLPWIICQFRHQHCPANGLSLAELKHSQLITIASSRD